MQTTEKFLVKGFRCRNFFLSKNIYSTFCIFALFLCEVVPDMHFNLQRKQTQWEVRQLCVWRFFYSARCMSQILVYQIPQLYVKDPLHFHLILQYYRMRLRTNIGRLWHLHKLDSSTLNVTCMYVCVFKLENEGSLMPHGK